MHCNICTLSVISCRAQPRIVVPLGVVGIGIIRKQVSRGGMAGGNAVDRRRPDVMRLALCDETREVILRLTATSDSRHVRTQEGHCSQVSGTNNAWDVLIVSTAPRHTITGRSMATLTRLYLG